jgi:small subunit ribosomal protein S20
MPVTKSAKKALKRSLFLRERNLKFKLAMKDAVRQFRKLIKNGEVDKAKEMLPDVYSKIDRCARRNIIHKNAAARKKSRLTALLQKVA